MLDVKSNRAERKWSKRTQVARVIWAFLEPLFSFSPRPLHELRCSLLRLFGARIGKNVYILPSVRITMPWNISISDDAAIGDRVILYALGPITIGERATVSQGAHLCAGSHDYRDPKLPLVKLPIVIGADVWVCADAFVGPGVSIGPGAIAGARSVVMSNVADDLIVVGNPARVIKRRG